MAWCVSRLLATTWWNKRHEREVESCRFETPKAIAYVSMRYKPTSSRRQAIPLRAMKLFGALSSIVTSQPR